MLLVSTSCFRGYWLHKICTLVSQSEYDGIDLVLSPNDYDTEDVAYLKTLEWLTGVKIQSITTYERKMDQKSMEFAVQVAIELGITLINIFPPHRLDRDGSWFNNLLPKLQSQYSDIRFAVMNVEPKTFLFFIPEYRDATLDNIKKITWDTALNISKVDPESGVDLIKTFAKLGNSIVNVFLSDKTAAKNDLIPGKGDMPLETLLIRLKEGGYKRNFTLKVDPKSIGVGNDETVLKRMADAKKFWEKHYN